MNGSVVVIAIGPVQGFIRAARRTADLYEGSRLLVELARTAADELRKAGATLCFPDPTVLDDMHRERLPIANKVVAVVQDADPREVVEAVVASIHGAWLETVDKVVARLVSRAADASVDIAALRRAADPKDWMETFAAWAPLIAPGPEGYADALANAQEMLEARKHLREFDAWEGQPLPKSSLDPGRETVFVGDGPSAIAAALNHATLFRAGETLDGVSLVKRLRPVLIREEQEEPFPSLSHIAARPALDQWFDRHKKDEEWVRSFVVAVQERVDARRYGKRYHRDSPLRVLDPEWFSVDTLEVSLAAAFRARGEAEHRENAQRAARALAGIWRERGLPKPGFSRYVAVLHADGDSMGEAVGRTARTGGIQGHQQLSSRLARFAREVASHLEEGQCNNSPLDGSCVYAGGDDVLAFLPVARALDGAAEVSRLFAEHLPQGDDKYSVSGGLVIAHTQTSFEELREAADRAEKLAKEERRKRVLLEGEEAVPGYLTIVVSKRSGNEATFVMPWKEAVDRLRDLARAFSMTRGGLSSKTPYDLREQLEGVPWCTPGTIPSWSGSVPEAEIRRILNRKRGGGETVDPAVASTVLKLFEDVAGDVGRWERGTWRRAVDALLIARSIAAEAQIGETTRAAGGKPR